MSDWIELDTAVLNAPHETKVAGVAVTSQFSPHDVPTAVRAFGSKGHRRVTIEFRYIDDEVWRVERYSEAVRLRVGRYSGRLYGVEVDMDEFRGEEHDIGQRVEQGESSNAQRLKESLAASTVRIVADVIERTTSRQPRTEGNFKMAKAGMASVEKLLAMAI